MPTQELIDTITEHEGSNKYVYKDSLGYYTIGIGRCADARCHHGLSLDEMQYLLKNDIQSASDELKDYEFYERQDDVRKEVLVELVFNMGLDHLQEFKLFLKAMLDLRYEDAVNELTDSLWAKEVGANRVDNICYRLVHGEYP